MEGVGWVAAVGPRVGQRAGFGERTCRKCTLAPSMAVVNCGSSLSLGSWADALGAEIGQEKLRQASAILDRVLQAVRDPALPP